MKEKAIEMLEKRGVSLTDLAKLAYDLQIDYIPDITIEATMENIHKVLEKREVQNAILTGIAIDQLAERNLFEEPLLSILKRDDSLYGIDEILALSITNIYGSIGLTNFGHLDKIKPGIIGKVNDAKGGQVNTFLDDLLSGIVAAACSRMAHAFGDFDIK
ncbi:phosphatidylglycerophosphatase A family protein [Alkaliphilus hydrothermalis]|uniref:Phosphatidylglycerophosphatase A n=1 Tax=Alkaliphilus hydrothermalis TaxID=1482730 RepID=A0ABS2NS45_9FIRM|nr:phosphatidylglycerophosphatase A [Alkaliphilus hydrothermalis]MBM7615768.1 phosphatidylglycerophosphatase A [Alkaliphilus hydrothermalis]